MRLLPKSSKVLARVVVIMNEHILPAPLVHALKTRPALVAWEGSRVCVTACRANLTCFNASRQRRQQ